MTDRFSTDDRLAGRVAVVTGASREIGAAMALALVQHGATVLLSHWGETELAETVAAQLRAAGGRVSIFEADLLRVESGRAMIEQAVREFGRLDIYVANAGVTHWSPFLDYSESGWDQVINLNLRGTFFSAQAAARQMIAQGKPGAILFSASVTGQRALPNASAYSLTKAGLIHLARVVALELGPYHISVNALVIGATVNQRNLKDDPEYEAHWAHLTPAGRPARPEDVARGMIYLLENPFITGSALQIDGGWTIRSPLP